MKSTRERNEFDIINWNVIKLKIQQKYSNLTNADIEWRDTNQEDMLNTIANILGITKKELKEVINQA